MTLTPQIERRIAAATKIAAYLITERIIEAVVFVFFEPFMVNKWMRKLSDIVPTIVTATTINELKMLSPALTRTFHKATKPFGISLLPYNLSAKASPYK